MELPKLAKQFYFLHFESVCIACLKYSMNRLENHKIDDYLGISGLDWQPFRFHANKLWISFWVFFLSSLKFKGKI